MAVTRREFVYGAVFLSAISTVVVVISLTTDKWVFSEASAEGQVSDSSVSYGFWSGQLVLRILATPTIHSLFMTCVFDYGACAVSCKTTADARREEVRALAEGFSPAPICTATTSIDYDRPLAAPAVISATIYVIVLLQVIIYLVFSIIASTLGVYNFVRNPTEPIFGLPGVLWANICGAVLGSCALATWGGYWAASSLQGHLALSYIAIGDLEPKPALGYSYWILIPAVVCSLGSGALLEVRKYLLEKDPPPPTIDIQLHSDGTVFLY